MFYSTCPLKPAVPHHVAIASHAKANPVRKIVTMLQRRQEKVLAKRKKEEDIYEKFMCYCEETTEGGTDEKSDIQNWSSLSSFVPFSCLSPPINNALQKQKVVK